MSNEHERTLSIVSRLGELYPDAGCALRYKSPYELLIATILSAQTTDKRVNEVTKELFKLARTPEEMIALDQLHLETIIQGCGLFRSKASNIIATSRILVEEYGGQVPQDMDSLTSLPGVGRKTANVVLSNAFGIPAMAVDTHVFRLANRLGLARANSPEKVEDGLKAVIPEELWTATHHRLIAHGRQKCDARKPKCNECGLRNLCTWPDAND